MYTSIAVDSSGYLHIGYFDASDRDLKYAKSSQPSPPVPESSTILMVSIGLLSPLSIIYLKKRPW